MANDLLLFSGTCGTTGCVNNCPNPNDWANLYYPWWDNWKDHLYYALSREYQPANAMTAPCGNCLSINGSGKYAAVVIFANRKLAGQTRASSATDPRRGIPSNYLEGANALNLASPSTGVENYQLDPAGSTFNDIVYCIRQDLQVVKGNPALAPPCP
jgi:hypothetical protein